jgi:hypothetical protein
MTATRLRPANPVAPPKHFRARSLAIVAAVAGGVTLVIRLALHSRSFDLFGDEVLYVDLGWSVISGGFPRYQGPFFLHGPGFFYMEAGWAHVTGTQHTVMGWVYDMRTLNALLAAATAVILVIVAAKAANLRAGAAAGFLFALEPFCIRQNDRVMLETAMMFWVMLGYLAFISIIGHPPERRDWFRAVGAGLAFGCAVLTKDEAALLTVLPLLAVVALCWGPRRGMTMLTVVTTGMVYAAYVVVVAANGQFSDLWVAKTMGIRRMLGIVQTTGFNSSGGGGSLSSRILAEASYFGTTYITLALAVPALLVILVRGSHVARILGLLYCAAGVTLGYAVIHGTLEEQELYLLIIPALIIIPVAVSAMFSERRHSLRYARRNRLVPKMAIIAALALVLGLNLNTCVQWLRQPDDGFAHLFQYMAMHVPAGTRIGVTDDDIAAEYGLSGIYDIEVLITPADQTQARARYILVLWASIDEGYSTFTSSQVRNIVGRNRPVFSYMGRTYGQLALYKLPLPMGSHVIPRWLDQIIPRILAVFLF